MALLYIVMCIIKRKCREINLSGQREFRVKGERSLVDGQWSIVLLHPYIDRVIFYRMLYETSAMNDELSTINSHVFTYSSSSINFLIRFIAFTAVS